MDSCISKCRVAFSKKNGLQLAEAIALPDGVLYHNIDSDLMSRLNNSNANAIASTCNDAVRNEHIAGVIANYFSRIKSIHSKNWSQAVDNCLSMYNSILEYLKDDNTSWALPVLIRVSNDLRLLAMTVS